MAHEALGDGYRVYTVHALYYLAEAAGWRSGLGWRLTGRGVYSPELQRLLVAGRPPRPDAEALARVRRLVRLLCGDGGPDCGVAVVLAAKYLAYARLGLDYEAFHRAPSGLLRRVAAALREAGLAPRKETIITPAPLAK